MAIRLVRTVREPIIASTSSRAALFQLWLDTLMRVVPPYMQLLGLPSPSLFTLEYGRVCRAWMSRNTMVILTGVAVVDGWLMCARR